MARPQFKKRIGSYSLPLSAPERMEVEGELVAIDLFLVDEDAPSWTERCSLARRHAHLAEVLKRSADAHRRARVRLVYSSAELAVSA